jgi:hypothetical protein
MENTTQAAPAAGGVPDSGAPVVESGEGYAAPEFTPAQTAGLAEINNLRAQASDPALEHGKRDALMQKLSEMQRHVFAGGEKPAWFGEALAVDPKTGMQEHDSFAASLGEGLTRPASAEELSHLRSAGTIKGLHPEVSGAVATFVRDLAMPKVIADEILARAVHHAGKEHDMPALSMAEAFRPLNDAEVQDFYNEASRVLGGSDKLDALTKEVRGLLQERGILAEMDRKGFTKISLAFDPRVLYALRLWLQTAPARA